MKSVRILLAVNQTDLGEGQPGLIPYRQTGGPVRALGAGDAPWLW